MLRLNFEYSVAGEKDRMVQVFMALNNCKKCKDKIKSIFALFLPPTLALSANSLHSDNYSAFSEIKWFTLVEYSMLF